MGLKSYLKFKCFSVLESMADKLWGDPSSKSSFNSVQSWLDGFVGFYNYEVVS